MTPKTVKIIGILGLLPFIVGVLATLELTLIFREYNYFLVEMSLTYAALILSFLGGSIFAFENINSEKRSNFGLWLSICPTLWAFLSINLPHFSASCLALGFVAVYEIDRRAFTSEKTPDWWLSIRLPLTAVVVLALAIIGFHD
ncbi:MAG: DUF3429 domain-containing protein [Pseudomonadota bacterium]|nr:DUF3429 domain-containing protein [Pseudomonadota bacterium]